MRIMRGDLTTNPLHKYDNRLNAFNSEKNSIRLLLQYPRGNQNAKNYQERGKVLFVAVWYQYSDWAILCNERYATLVSPETSSSLKRCKTNNSDIEYILSNLFEQAPLELRKELNDDFYQSNISINW